MYAILKYFTWYLAPINRCLKLWITVGRKGKTFFQMIECHLHMLIKQFYQSLKKPWGTFDITKVRNAGWKVVRLLTHPNVHTSKYLCQYYASFLRRPSRDKTRRIRFYSRTPLHFVRVSSTRHIKVGIREQDVLGCGAREHEKFRDDVFHLMCLFASLREGDRMSAIIQCYVLKNV